ncbi:MAG: YeeE/YedE thiosulfate transporter family protein [Nannocystaceae bacterium]
MSRADTRLVAYGLALGYVLSHMGFTDAAQVQAMFALTDPRLWLGFGLAVIIAAIGFRRDRLAAPERPLHAGVVPGAILFGVGWAVCGTCTGSSLAALGEGQLAVAVSVLGVVAGTWGYGAIHRRWFRWDPGSCGL